MLIRNATYNDLEWINKQYSIINFLHSDLEDEDIVIAEIEGKNVALGRLQKIGTEESELGGIYVLPEYRKLGIGRKIVSKLVKIGSRYKKIYCLPFANLQEFYCSFGFEIIETFEDIPEKVLKKHQWCNSTYDVRVLLLAKQKVE